MEPNQVIEDQVGGMGDFLLDLAGVGLGSGVILYALFMGWRLVRAFIAAGGPYEGPYKGQDYSDDYWRGGYKDSR